MCVRRRRARYPRAAACILTAAFARLIWSTTLTALYRRYVDWILVTARSTTASSTSPLCCFCTLCPQKRGQLLSHHNFYMVTLIVTIFLHMNYADSRQLKN